MYKVEIKTVNHGIYSSDAFDDKHQEDIEELVLKAVRGELVHFSIKLDNGHKYFFPQSVIKDSVISLLKVS